MKQKKMLLHEAIVAVLKEKPNKTASTEEIASEINSKSLYQRKDKTPLPAYQVMMRTKLSGGRHHDLFEYIEPGIVKLR